MIAFNSKQQFADWSVDQLQQVKRLLDFSDVQPAPIKVKRVIPSSPDEPFFVAARIENRAAPFVREGDVFSLIDTQGGIRTNVATLRLHQPVTDDGGAFFVLETPLNETAINDLRSYARVTGNRIGTHDLIVEPSLDLSQFEGINLDSAIAAITKLISIRNDASVGETNEHN